MTFCGWKMWPQVWYCSGHTIQTSAVLPRTGLRHKQGKWGFRLRSCVLYLCLLFSSSMCGMAPQDHVHGGRSFDPCWRLLRWHKNSRDQAGASFRGYCRRLRPHKRLWNKIFFSQLRKLKTANQLWNVEITWFFKPRNAPKLHFPVALPLTPLSEHTALLSESSAGEEGACRPQEPHPVPALSPSGLRLQLFEPRFTKPPGWTPQSLTKMTPLRLGLQ